MKRICYWLYPRLIHFFWAIDGGGDCEDCIHDMKRLARWSKRLHKRSARRAGVDINDVMREFTWSEEVTWQIGKPLMWAYNKIDEWYPEVFEDTMDGLNGSANTTLLAPTKDELFMVDNTPRDLVKEVVLNIAPNAKFGNFVDGKFVEEKGE